MLKQHEDGSHEISLLNIRRHGCDPYPGGTGIFRWSHDKGVRFELEFPDIYSLEGSPFYKVTAKKRGQGAPG